MDTSRHFIEKIFWIIIYIAAAYGAFLCGNAQYQRFQANPIVISLEKDYRNWEGVLPGMTLCYKDRMDDNNAAEYIQSKWGVNETSEKFDYYMKFVNTVLHLTIDNFETLSTFQNDIQLDEIDFLDVVRNIHRENEVSVLMYDAEVENFMHRVLTERGLCYSMYTSNIELAFEDVSQSPSAKFYTCSFSNNQCYFRLYVTNATIMVAIHSPYDVITEASSFITVDETNLIYATYKIMETIVTNEVRYLSPTQRKCLFYDEPQPDMNVYSVGLCILNCKAKAAIALCGCKPYFYHSYPGKSCTPRGYMCLRNADFPKKYVKQCECPQTCTDYAYFKNSVKTTSWKKHGDSSVMQKSSIRFEVVSGKLKMRREVIFKFTDLLVSVGGAATLFLGFSTLDLCGWAYDFLHYVYNCGNKLICNCKLVISKKKKPANKKNRQERVPPKLVKSKPLIVRHKKINRMS